MKSQAAISPAPIVAKQRSFGTFRTLQIVIGVALLVATLFTAWTPSGALPNKPSDLLGLVPLVRATNQAKDASVTPTPRARPLIGIVAGHWGNDSGAVCQDGKTEVEINQNIAYLVQKALLTHNLDVDVLHEFDSKLSGYQASALVSIHADSCDYVNDQATGFKVAAALANPHPERAARLTACIRSRYGQITGLPLHSTSITNDMTSYHAFGEIDPNTTAAIIEVGFLNLDRQFLEQKADVAAQGIVDGILCFLRNEDITLPTATPQANQ